jgi:hypothetical protein
MGKTHAVLGSPVLWLTLLAASAIAAACGSSDSHKSQADDGGASAGGRAGSAGERATPNTSASGAGGAAGEASDPGVPSSGAGPIGGVGGGAGSTNGGDSAAAGAGGAPSGCLALHFGANTDTVQVPDDSIPDFGAAATMELWLLADANDAGTIAADGVLINKWTNFLEDKYLSLNLDGSVYTFWHGNSGELASFSSTPAVEAAKWAHVAVVYDATSVRLYANGVKVGEKAGAIQPDSSGGPVQIGATTRDSVRAGLRGFYSDVRLSSVARYTADFTPPLHLTSDADTIGLWQLDEGSGDVAEDSSTFDNPGTISGAAWQLAPCR